MPNDLSPLFQVLVPIVIVAIAIAGIALRHIAADKRRKALGALASKLGWTFDPRHNPHHDEQFRQFGEFLQGHARRAFNTLSGQIRIQGRDFQGMMGDYSYKETSGSGKDRRTTTYRFSYLLLRPPWATTPELRIRPENLFDKIAGAIGFDDIDFESAEFSRKFHVKCPDKRLAYDVITPQMMEFLLGSAPQSVEIDGGWCLFYQGNGRWKPEQFENALAWTGRFFEQWPEHLLDSLGAAPPKEHSA